MLGMVIQHRMLTSQKDGYAKYFCEAKSRIICGQVCPGIESGVRAANF